MGLNEISWPPFQGTHMCHDVGSRRSDLGNYVRKNI